MSDKHTDGAVRAAQKIDDLIDISLVCRHSDKRKKDIAAIIDEEITAERDRLREEIKGLNKRIEKLRDAAVTHYRKLYGATPQPESGEKDDDTHKNP